MFTTDQLLQDAVHLLKGLIAIPRISRDETAAADYLQRVLEGYGEAPLRDGNNLLLTDPGFDEARPTLLLNAHIDTVKPSSSWHRLPFQATEEDDRIFGIGSNDCGGGLVTLLQAFRVLTSKPQKYNILYLASAEEEVSGAHGFTQIAPRLPEISVAIVGEPTGMQPAVAEKGLMVLDITAHGKAGHAARNEGVNAIYEALEDINWIHNYRFNRVSRFLGATQMQLTVINAGSQHNVVPDTCNMVVDVRTNELYSNQEVLDIIKQHLHCDCEARSTRLSSSSIDLDHPIVQRCIALGMTPYGSPPLSDQALMPWPSMKLGPGDSARSHTADEYICISEMRNAIETYINLLDGLSI